MTPSCAEGSLIDAAATAERIAIDRLAPGTVLVLAPHPDDETFGCGLAIAAAAERGIFVHIVTVTYGEASHPNSSTFPPDRLRSFRMREFECAVRALGVDTITCRWLDYPDGKMDARHINGLKDEIIAIAEEVEAAVLWTTWEDDPHCDHRTTAQAATAAANHCAISLWQYAVWGRFGNRAVPSVDRLRRFDAASQRDRKREAAACYRTQTTDLINDDPNGFRMPDNLLEHFIEHDEIFIGPANDGE